MTDKGISVESFTFFQMEQASKDKEKLLVPIYHFLILF